MIHHHAPEEAAAWEREQPLIKESLKKKDFLDNELEMSVECPVDSLLPGKGLEDRGWWCLK